MRKLLRFLFVATSAVMWGCDSKNVSTSPRDVTEDDNAKAGRIIKQGFDAQVFWPGGSIPYYFNANMTTPQRNLVRQAIQSWQQPLTGIVLFTEVSSSATGPKLMFTIGSAVWGPGLAGGSCTGFNRVSGQTITLDQSIFSLVTAANPNPWTTGFAPVNDEQRAMTTTAKAMVVHEIGHALGLAHEQKHPKIRDYATPIPKSGCVTTAGANGLDVYYYWGGEKTDGVVVPGEDAAPDFESVMIYPFGSCPNGVGYSLWSVNSTGELIIHNYEPSSGDLEAVRGIYRSPSAGPLKWNPSLAINLQYYGTNLAGRVASETVFKTAIVDAASRWLSLLDPSVGAMAKTPPTPVKVTPSQGGTNVIRVYVDPDENERDFTISCNPSLPTNYCEIGVGDALDDMGNHLLNDPDYLANVLGTAIGYALGLGVNNPNSSTYIRNNVIWEKEVMVPTIKDVSSIRALYGSPGNYKPLIRIGSLSMNSSSPYNMMYFTSWDDVRRYRSVASGAYTLAVLGRVPSTGSSVTTGKVTSPLSLDYRQNTIGEYYFEVLHSGASLSSLANAVAACPTEARASASTIQALTARSFGNVSLFAASQSGANTPLVAYWHPTYGIWIVRDNYSSLPCNIVLGYMASK